MFFKNKCHTFVIQIDEKHVSSRNNTGNRQRKKEKASVCAGGGGVFTHPVQWRASDPWSETRFLVAHRLETRNEPQQNNSEHERRATHRGAEREERGARRE